MGGNGTTMQVLADDPYMHDPTLRGRLGSVETPTTVVWGESDRIVTPAYGRAYASSFGSGAELVVVPAAGQLPHLEQPSATYAVLDRIVAARG
jgi:pimeloyl-ACP methyl ester carboxylesterase